MYAVIRTGGKQYKVAPGQSINVDKLDQSLGAKFQLPEVLMIGGEKTAFGVPTVAGAVVSAVVTEIGRAKKIFVFKKKRRHKYRRQRGHRQDFTRLFIESISFDGHTENAQGKPQILDPNRPKKEKPPAAVKAAKHDDHGHDHDHGHAPAKKASSAKAGKGKGRARAVAGGKSSGAPKRSASAKKKAGAAKAKKVSKAKK